MTAQNTITATQANPLEARVKALLIAGGSWDNDKEDGERFLENTNRLNDYLTSIGIDGKIINGDNTTEDDLLKRLRDISDSEEIDTLVLAYNGHAGYLGPGKDDYWGIKKDIRISFSKVCEALQLDKPETKLRVIFIVESCYAGDLVPVLKKYPTYPNQVLIYAACGEGKENYGGFISSLLEKITGRLVYDRHIKEHEPYIIRGIRYLGLNFLLPRLLKEPQPRSEYRLWNIISEDRRDVIQNGWSIFMYNANPDTLSLLSGGRGPIVAGNLELEKVLTNNRPVFSG